MARPVIDPDANGVLRIVKSPHAKVDLTGWQVTGIIIEDSPHVQLWGLGPGSMPPITWDNATVRRFEFERDTTTDQVFLARQGASWLMDQLSKYGIPLTETQLSPVEDLAIMLRALRLARPTGRGAYPNE